MVVFLFIYVEGGPKNNLDQSKIGHPNMFRVSDLGLMFAGGCSMVDGFGEGKGHRQLLKYL